MTDRAPGTGTDEGADQQAAVEAMARQPRLGRVGLLIWLILPVVIVLLLWLLMDRERGRPRPDMSEALGPGQHAPIGSERPPEPNGGAGGPVP